MEKRTAPHVALFYRTLYSEKANGGKKERRNRRKLLGRCPLRVVIIGLSTDIDSPILLKTSQSNQAFWVFNKFGCSAYYMLLYGGCLILA
ncbi:hypothetical protein L3X38_006418 [Prunus dulcis]|uniref:Uncharacterized protein n=1 Tax=Prunus dulcis TaxID=3755 RepID=A0AAD5F529_PRUDU|nr:hypothetical protein L3X38_006418 [Prunus dulcis]